MSFTKKEIDSLEIPLKVYNGFLLITEPGGIEIMAPQFARFNITTQLFCNEEWADREALYRVRNYINGIVFAEPLAAKEDAEYMRFARQLSNFDSTHVNEHHLAGERAARIVEFGLERAQESDSLRKALSMVRELTTLSGEVSLIKEERVDRNVTLVQFSEGTFKVLDK